MNCVKLGLVAQFSLASHEFSNFLSVLGGFSEIGRISILGSYSELESCEWCDGSEVCT